MTHHPIRTLSDGRKKYSNYTTYTPTAPEDRKYSVRKPDHPDAIRFHGDWFLPLDVLPDLVRVMPTTRADSDAYDHMGRGRPCVCDVCLRPEAKQWQAKWWKDRGVRFVAKRQR